MSYINEEWYINHQKFLSGEEGGVCADLRFADLRFANLRFANLRFANLTYTKGVHIVSASGYTGIVHASGLSIGCETHAFDSRAQGVKKIAEIGETNDATAIEIKHIQYLFKLLWDEAKQRGER